MMLHSAAGMIILALGSRHDHSETTALAAAVRRGNRHGVLADLETETSD
jgi:hypothetical protein